MDYYKELTEQAKEGFESPLKAYIELKKEIDRLTKLQSEIKRDAIEEARKGEKTQVKFGAVVTYLPSAGNPWSFKGIPDWEEKKSELKEIEEMHKKAFKLYLKGKTMVDEDGVVIEPAKHKSSSTISVSFEKTDTEKHLSGDQQRWK